jgi:hypothetical protein
MLRTLLRKEWRQLRQLRWAGAGIGLLMPFLLLVLASASDRGWLLGESNSSPVTVVRDLLPMMLSLAIWPLMGLMAAAQAFVADRATGTDAFLLERPVPRSTIWIARLIAVVATTVAIMATGLAVWWVAVLLVGEPGSFGMLATLGQTLFHGSLATAVAVIAGMAAGAYVRSPMQGVLLGMILTAIPVGVAALFSGGLFWGYRLRGTPIGVGIPLFLLIGYLVGSFRADCLGEPAGRGRLRRAATAMTMAFVAMPLFVAASAPLVMRWDAKLGLGNTTVVPAPTGEAAFVLNNSQRAGWLIDTTAGRRIEFFGPPIYGVAWNEAGTRLAMLHGAGAAGRLLSDYRIEILDPAGRSQREAIVCGECRRWWKDEMFWIDGRVILPGFAEGREVLLIVDASSGEKTSIEMPQPAPQWELLPPIGGEIHVLVIRRRPGHSRTAPARQLVDGELFRVDIEAGSLGPAVELPDIGSPYYAHRALSPSGRLWLTRPASRHDTARVIDIATGETRNTTAKSPVWLADDRLAWFEVATDSSGWLIDGTFELFIGPPGDGRPVREFRGTWFQIYPAPDGERLLVSGWTLERELQHWFFDPGTESWNELPATSTHSSAGDMQWIRPELLAIVEPGALALLETSDEAEKSYVIGSPRH